MLPALAVAVGLVWFFADQAKKSNAKPDDSPEPSPEPERPPVDGDADGDGIVEFEEIYSWSPEATIGSETVWTFQKGIIREDGSREMGNSYVVIGNSTHTEFLRQNARGGTINIKWEATGRTDKRDSKNVVVFGSVEDAIAYLEEEEEDDPTSPQRPEDTPPAPTPPPSYQPDFGLGGGGTSLFTNGGI